MSKYDLSRLKCCVTAGEPLNPEVYQKFFEITGLKLMEGFGQTETIVTLATFPWMDPKPGSMGKPSPQYSIELFNLLYVDWLRKFSEINVERDGSFKSICKSASINIFREKF